MLKHNQDALQVRIDTINMTVMFSPLIILKLACYINHCRKTSRKQAKHNPLASHSARDLTATAQSKADSGNKL